MNCFLTNGALLRQRDLLAFQMLIILVFATTHSSRWCGLQAAATSAAAAVIITRNGHDSAKPCHMIENREENERNCVCRYISKGAEPCRSQIIESSSLIVVLIIARIICLFNLSSNIDSYAADCLYWCKCGSTDSDHVWRLAWGSSILHSKGVKQWECLPSSVVESRIQSS